jgi:hypothetical protein
MLGGDLGMEVVGASAVGKLGRLTSGYRVIPKPLGIEPRVCIAIKLANRKFQFEALPVEFISSRIILYRS